MAHVFAAIQLLHWPLASALYMHLSLRLSKGQNYLEQFWLRSCLSPVVFMWQELSTSIVFRLILGRARFDI